MVVQLAEILSTANGGLKPIETEFSFALHQTFYRQWRTETHCKTDHRAACSNLSTANGGLKLADIEIDPAELKPFYRQWRTETPWLIQRATFSRYFLPPMAD